MLVVTLACEGALVCVPVGCYGFGCQMSHALLLPSDGVCITSSLSNIRLDLLKSSGLTCLCPVPLFACSGEILAYKAVVAGDTSAASTKNGALSLASGSYTFWKDAGASVGKSQDVVPNIATYAACLSACDSDAACAAVVMTDVSAATGAASSCKLVKGESAVAQFKRSVTKTVVTQLEVANAA